MNLSPEGEDGNVARLNAKREPTPPNTTLLNPYATLNLRIMSLFNTGASFSARFVRAGTVAG
ncbi:hypothetical protein KKD49_13435 [Myxococcota bacterium]|nr:hypothetical protein [Myxococcota bacterium]